MISPLLSAQELQAALPGSVVLDARVGADARLRYRDGHLPGAHFADLDTHLAARADDPATGGRHPLPSAARFAQQLGRWGITPDAHVIVYDDAGGANAAARAWWMIRAIGHENVQVLDGGLPAARAAGVPLTTERPTEVDAGPYPSSAFSLPTADIHEVDRARVDPARRILDARAAPRYRGETEPFDPIAGHIPGAANLFFFDHLDADGRFRPVAEVRAQIEAALDGVPSERAIVSCGSGVTACHTLLAMAHAGMPLAALYVGSWSEWCRSGKPQATGNARG
jgi:thiosulfate/3-mercaptopyruvate sulfurtransferase